MKDGWYTAPELDFLNRWAGEAPDGDFVEIGTFRGRSAEVLARHRCGTKLILVDNMSMGDYREEWPQDAIHVMCDPLEVEAVLPDEIALLHHDADHTEEVVSEHLYHLLPRVVPAGIVALHDFHSLEYPGVRRAWDKATRFTGARWNQEYLSLGGIHTLAVFRRIR